MLAALVLAGLPPFGVAFGKDVAEHALETHRVRLAGGGVRGLVSAVTAAAVLRAGLGVYFGLGTAAGARRRREDHRKG